MCGIIGYTGIKDARQIIIDGMYSLEYRGYDSAGMAIVGDDGRISIEKHAGRVSELVAMSESIALEGHTGIGHTRWATHGAPTKENAHPHSSDSVVLVHNGIIDNSDDIKRMLKKDGYVFKSETDTEAVVHLIDREYRNHHSPEKALHSAAKLLEGSYALAVLFKDYPGVIWATKKDNPLIIATGDDGCYVASDVPAVLKHTSNVFRPTDNTVVRLTGSSAEIVDSNGTAAPIATEKADRNHSVADKEGFPHFMLKEIFEEPASIRRCISHRIEKNGLPDFSADGIPESFWSGFDSIQIISCGSATHAGHVGRYLIESLAGIPVTVNTASEYRYDPPATIGKTLAVAISQSGETADTLAGLRLAKRMGFVTLGIINVYGSAIAREADYVLYTNAGPEIAVATTKGYATQVAMLSLIACSIALSKGKMTAEDAKDYCRCLNDELPMSVQDILKRRSEIRDIAEYIKNRNDVFFIGRGQDYASAIECSLKLKEISYIHSEAYAAGELKHGTLSLIENGTPCVSICTDKKYYDKMIGNIREVKARGGCIILLHTPDFPHPEELSDLSFVLPLLDSHFTPLISVVFSQLLAYDTSILRGCDVDHPRNLAKSVTVE